MKVFVLIGYMLLFSGCCLVRERRKPTIIYGSYKIVNKDSNTANVNMVIKGLVYDKETKAPIKGVAVAIEKLKKGVFTDSSGNYFLEISDTGYYKIEVINVENTTIVTKPIKFSKYKEMEIDFYLGTIKENYEW